jgi:hypothetical protein
MAGIIGEKNTSKLLFIIASTYKMGYPLHAIVQGSSGSGKSHLINIIGQCLPQEDVLYMTRVTSKSFYHYGKDELVNKLIVIQDFDGLDNDAQYAFSNLQNLGSVSSSTTHKDKYGNIVSTLKSVNSHFSSIVTTKNAENYYDNMGNSVTVGVDESVEQTYRTIDYQNQKIAGLIDSSDEQKAKHFLQNCIRCIKPYEVVNIYAHKIRLPFEVKMARKLNFHYQSFVKQITILNQYQRNKDDKGRLITQPEDLQIACDVLFDVIMLKVDDLDSSLRHFFDSLKNYILKIDKAQDPKHLFSQREVRLALKISKTQCFRNLQELERLEYIDRIGGYANKGYKYRISHWDDMHKIRDKIKTELNQQLLTLENDV